MIYLGWLVNLTLLSITIIAFAGLLGFSATETQYWTLFIETYNDSYIQSIVVFSLKQALLSAALSVTLAIPIARALYFIPKLRYKTTFLSLCTLCFVLPTLVLITGLVVLLGRSGFLTPTLNWISRDHWNIYGLTGILIAHVYLNLPFAIRSIYQQYQGISDTSWKLSHQLKLSYWNRFKIVEWPAIKHSIGVTTGFIFVLCFNSFAVVLALGGGPKSTTLEVAIYQALKYDFDIPLALALSWLQFLIAGLAFVYVTKTGHPSWLNIKTISPKLRPKFSRKARYFHQSCYYLCWLFLTAPLISLLPAIFPAISNPDIWSSIAKPTFNSLILSVTVAFVATQLAYFAIYPGRVYSRASKNNWRILSDWLTTHSLVIPAMVLSVGTFIFWLRKIDLDSFGIGFIWLLNLLIVMPFAVTQIRPQLVLFDRQYNNLVQNLKLSAYQKIRIELKYCASAFFMAFAFAMVLAIGDVAIFSIFGNKDWTTLPWLIYRYAGTYRISEAALASIVLLCISALVIFVFEKARNHASN